MKVEINILHIFEFPSFFTEFAQFNSSYNDRMEFDN